MKVLAVLFLLVAGVYGVWDTDFCKNQNVHKDVRLIPVPEYSREFETTVEATTVGGMPIQFYHLTLSKQNQLLELVRRTIKDTTTVYVLPGMDAMKENTFTPGEGYSCNGDPLQDSEIATEYNIHYDKNAKKLEIPGMRYMLAYTNASSIQLVGDTTVRGIEARRWNFCAYQNWTGDTISADLYYSGENVQMPGSDAIVPLLLESHVKKANGDKMDIRYDYTHYVDKVNPNRKSLQVPSTMYCKGTPSADHDLPRTPFDFHFKGVMKTLGDLNSIPAPKPILKYVKETYGGLLRIFTEDSVKTSDKLVTATRSRLVHDYTSGLQYDINLTTGLCTASKINKDHDDFKTGPLGLVRMKSPAEFFNLDGNHYQYIGKHEHFDRDIEADVYTALMSGDGKDMMMTWWFASKNFLKTMGYSDYFMMPLRYKSVINDPSRAESMDIFQFSSDPRENKILPDLSACFSPSKQLYLEITLTGRYYMTYLISPGNYSGGFVGAVMKAAGIINLARIARLRFEPADKDNTLAKFTLLDKPSMTGNVLAAMTEPGNDVVWPKLKKVLDNGQFKMTYHDRYSGKVKTANGIRYKKDFQDPKSFDYNAAKAASQSASSSSGYSAGAMGGLAVGMILLGILLGFVIIKVVGKVQNRVPDINMTQLGKQP